MSISTIYYIRKLEEVHIVEIDIRGLMSHIIDELASFVIQLNFFTPWRHQRKL
jgi:hypothetical protein